nr:M48 family metallopeptidase [Solimonas marina]
MPASLVRQFSRQTLDVLDHQWLQPSTLPSSRQDALRVAAQRLRSAEGSPLAFKLVFRASKTMGPNAFALPDGTIVLLDELVALADNDDELMAVVAHELGHVRHRHGLRLMAQGAAVGLLATWWFGDVSTLLATAPTVLAQAHYSREFETEADDDAVRTLRASGIAPECLATLLRKLAVTQKGRESQGFGGLLDSHPALLARARRVDGEVSAGR